jgi:hypothetical protein
MDTAPAPVLTESLNANAAWPKFASKLLIQQNPLSGLSSYP